MATEIKPGHGSEHARQVDGEYIFNDRGQVIGIVLKGDASFDYAASDQESDIIMVIKPSTAQDEGQTDK